jgi:hypothetical protein
MVTLPGTWMISAGAQAIKSAAADSGCAGRAAATDGAAPAGASSGLATERKVCDI